MSEPEADNNWQRFLLRHPRLGGVVFICVGLLVFAWKGIDVWNAATGITHPTSVDIEDKLIALGVMTMTMGVAGLLGGVYLARAFGPRRGWGWREALTILCAVGAVIGHDVLLERGLRAHGFECEFSDRGYEVWVSRSAPASSQGGGVPAPHPSL